MQIAKEPSFFRKYMGSVGNVFHFDGMKNTVKYLNTVGNTM